MSQDFAGAAPSLMDDVALLALVLAHGTDGAVHADEVRVLLDSLSALKEDLPGDAEKSLQRAAGHYEGVQIEHLEDVADRIARALAPAPLARVFAVLVAVAEADGVLHPMEATFLRHLAQAWRVGIWPGAGAPAAATAG
jgi:uncharacterized tellurite resistance protein B-like protein